MLALLDAVWLEIKFHAPPPAVSKTGGLPAPVEVNTCPSEPVATAAGFPEASYVIKLPSVPDDIFAKEIILSVISLAVSAASAGLVPM